MYVEKRHRRILEAKFEIRNSKNGLRRNRRRTHINADSERQYLEPKMKTEGLTQRTNRCRVNRGREEERRKAE
jgi:hypothetical protein